MNPSQIVLAVFGSAVAISFGGYHLYLFWYSYFVFGPAEKERKAAEAEKLLVEARLRKIGAGSDTLPANEIGSFRTRSSNLAVIQKDSGGCVEIATACYPMGA